MTTTAQSPAALQGDEDQLYRHHAGALRHIVRMRVNTTNEIVEDACGFAWLQLVRCQPRRDTAIAWLKRVAIREAIRLDRLQRSASATAVDGLEHPALRDHRTDPATQDEVIEALDVLAALQHRQRVALGLHALGFHYREIGEMTGDTVRTVARHIFRARRAVREHTRR